MIWHTVWDVHFQNFHLKQKLFFVFQLPTSDPTDYVPENDSHRDTWTEANITSKEYLAIQVACKIKSNSSQNDFFRHVYPMARVLPLQSGLPTSLYYAKQHLDNAKKFNPSFIVYCHLCHDILGTFPQFQKEGHCDHCKLDLEVELKLGNCQFITLPIRKQIELYVGEDNYFKSVLTDFAEMEESHPKGKQHGDNIKQFHFDFTLTIDGASLYKKQGTGALPALLLLNNLPVSHQLRFPILAAIFVGTHAQQPPRNVFLSAMCKEFKDLNQNPVFWTDRKGNSRKSRSYLTTVITDAPEKSVMMKHVGHGAKFGCQFCMTTGESITIEEYPHVFDNNPFRRTKGEAQVGGGKRYPKLLNEDDSATWRTSSGRLRNGLTAIRLQREKGISNIAVLGVKGIPALTMVPGLDETDSYVCDPMHVIYEGLAKDILDKVIKGRGKDHNLKREGNDFSAYDNILETMTRCHEAERNTLPLARYSAWNAFDYMMFLQHLTALYCADNKQQLEKMEVYDILVHLANVHYYCQYGRMTEEIIQKLEQEIEKFCIKLRSTFKEEYCTYKFHVLQHFPTFIRNHGSAFGFDAFNMERFNLYIRQMTTRPGRELTQAVENFILKHHNALFDDLENFHPVIQEILGEMGIENDIFGEKFKNKVRNFLNLNFEHQVQEKIKEALEIEGLISQEFDQRNWKNVSQMYRRNILLEIAEFKHPKGSQVKDSYVMIDGEDFGEIKSICWIPPTKPKEEGTFIIVLTKFQQCRPTADFGGVYSYPVNQIPFCFPNPSFPDLVAKILKRETFIQKAHVGKAIFKDYSYGVHIFSIFPNEYLRS